MNLKIYLKDLPPVLYMKLEYLLCFDLIPRYYGKINLLSLSLSLSIINAFFLYEFDTYFLFEIIHLIVYYISIYSSLLI